MGVSNRQRRAAKQKQRRSRAARPPRTEGRQGAPEPDDRLLAYERTYAAADALRVGDAPEARTLIGMLEDGPPAIVGAALADALRRQRALLERHGWTESDCDELERRRLKVAPEASAVERSVRLLALLCDLPELPPIAPRIEQQDDDGTLAKIRALLAKAESTTFPAEAEALSAKAQELMARHRIDRLVLDAGVTDGLVGRRIWLDDPYADAKANLLGAVAAANRCRSIQLTSVGVCHVIGFATDLDVVELLHTSLLVQATTAIAAAGPQRDARGRSRTRSFRQSFLIAYGHRIGRRLREASETIESEAVEEVRAGGVDLLPVLASRDAAVDNAVRSAFPRLVSRRVSVSNEAGWIAGTTAAELADLSVGDRLTP